MGDLIKRCKRAASLTLSGSDAWLSIAAATALRGVLSVA